MYTKKDRISTTNSLERIEESYRGIYTLLSEADIDNKAVFEKLKIELSNHDAICSKLWGERYTAQKYEDRWYDDLFKEYQTSKARISVLMEIMES